MKLLYGMINVFLRDCCTTFSLSDIIMCGNCWPPACIVSTETKFGPLRLAEYAIKNIWEASDLDRQGTALAVQLEIATDYGV